MKKIVIYFCFIYCIVFFVGCNADSKTEVVVLRDTAKTENLITNNTKGDADSMIVFTNVEQIEYCVPLPLNEYIENFDRSDTKAKHVFKHKTKKDNEMELQGFFREDPSVSLEDYFKNSYLNAEEEGKVITKKEIVKDNNCFYAKGYMSNFIYEYRFIEVAWLRKDEVVVFSSTYDISDTTLWDERLKILISSTAACN